MSLKKCENGHFTHGSQCNIRECKPLRIDLSTGEIIYPKNCFATQLDERGKVKRQFAPINKDGATLADISRNVPSKTYIPTGPTAGRERS